MTKVPILVMPERLASLADVLARDYSVERWWQLGDQDAFLENEARHVRCIVAGGASFPPPATLERFESLELLACVSVGYEGIDVAWCRAKGIAVTTGSGANASYVGEYAAALALAYWCGIPGNDMKVRRGEWRVNSLPQRRALRGRRVGIVGMGAIGREIAARLAGFGVTIDWWGPRDNPSVPYPRSDSLLALADACDILFVACRADETNHHLIDEEVIAAVGGDGLIVNVARGSLVDEVAIRTALRAGTLGGFATDVFETEPTPPGLWDAVPNALLSPHAAAATFEGRDALQERLVENMARHFAGLPMIYPLVDRPAYMGPCR